MVHDVPLDDNGDPWDFEEMNGEAWWTSGVGNFANGGFNNFVIIYDGLQTVIYDQAGFDIDGGAILTFDDWVVSTVPVPGAALLAAIGLGMVGWLKRRIT